MPNLVGLLHSIYAHTPPLKNSVSKILHTPKNFLFLNFRIGKILVYPLENCGVLVQTGEEFQSEFSYTPKNSGEQNTGIHLENSMVLNTGGGGAHIKCNSPFYLPVATVLKVKVRLNSAINRPGLIYDLGACYVRRTVSGTIFGLIIWFSLWRRAYAQNVRLYNPYRQYTNLFLFSICTWTLPTQHT